MGVIDSAVKNGFGLWVRKPVWCRDKGLGGKNN
jgi:hypothetical protein